MLPHIDNPFDTRPPGKKGTAGFLDALGDQQAAEAYRQAMGEGATPSTTDDQEQGLTPEELARVHAAEAGLRETQEKRDLAALKADYLAWAREFKLGGDDPQAWLDKTFIFNPDGTVERDGGLGFSGIEKPLTRLPRNLSRVNGDFYLAHNHLTSLEGLPQEIHGDLDLTDNPLTTLDGLKGIRVDQNLYLERIPDTDIPEGIRLGGWIHVHSSQAVLADSVKAKGYKFVVE